MNNNQEKKYYYLKAFKLFCFSLLFYSTSISATILEREKVDRWYQSEGFIRHVERCLKTGETRFYIEHIENVFRQYGLPKDLIYLPIIESCYDPFAVSSAGAVGMWQINDITAEHVELREGFFLDERYNWKKSTVKAAEYLLFLRERFPNWTLALAAYNVGPGYVRSQMKRRKTTDVEKLRLPRETRDYVYKFAAMIRHINEMKSNKELVKNDPK